MNLLIVDDDSISTFINTRLAETTGLFEKILSAHNGKDALDIFEQASEGKIAAPDLVLLDLNMPVMSGFDFIEAVQQTTFPWKDKLAIVILTSSDNALDIERAQSFGIEHYILKSLPGKAFQQAIFSLCTKIRSNLHGRNTPQICPPANA